jgi:hypothetical protein
MFAGMSNGPGSCDDPLASVRQVLVRQVLACVPAPMNRNGRVVAQPSAERPPTSNFEVMTASLGSHRTGTGLA